MSEDLTRDPLLGPLARFRPTTVGIDRDAMLFAAGRASAPKAREWKFITAVLTISHLAMLGIWFAGPRAERLPNGPPALVAERPLDLLPSPADEPLTAASYGELARWRDRGELPSSPPVADPALPHPALSVAAGRYGFGSD